MRSDKGAQTPKGRLAERGAAAHAAGYYPGYMATQSERPAFSLFVPKVLTIIFDDSIIKYGKTKNCSAD